MLYFPDLSCYSFLNLLHVLQLFMYVLLCHFFREADGFGNGNVFWLYMNPYMFTCELQSEKFQFIAYIQSCGFSKNWEGSV